MATTSTVDRKSPSPADFARFTLALLAFAVLPALFLVAFVVAVDPYYVVGSPSWRGINVVRPFSELHVLEAKPYQVRRIKPDAVSLGSSVVEVALDPRHAGWGHRKVFNFGLPSATSYEVMLAFLHAGTVAAPLKQAVVGLDFFGFNIFFPRNEQVHEVRFAGDAAEAFADFLAIELAHRPHGEGAEGYGPPPPAADSSDAQPWNEALYLAVNPDVAGAIARRDFKSGREHYLLAGRAEGRKGGTIPSNWDEALYLELHADVAAEVKRGTFLSGYHHYLAAGRAEGRESGTPPGNWNETLYLRINPDVKNEVTRGTFLSGYHHYLAAGRSERRSGGTVPLDWDEATYLQVNRDVEYQISQGLFLSGYHHYLVAGRAEKRLGGHRPAGWNEAQYLATNPAARIRIGLGDYRSGYAHYAAVGQRQGLQGGFPPAGLMERLRARWPQLTRVMFQVDEGFRLLFSATAVSDSVATIFRQSDAATFDERGMRVWKGQDETLRQAGGNGRTFRAHLLGWRWYLWLMPPRSRYCFTNTDTGMTTFDPYRFMLRRAYTDGTDMRLYVTPVNAAVRTLIGALGLGEHYDLWLKELVRINEEEAARAGREPLPLWDFSDPNAITREPIPLGTDPTPMRWFWEHSHYRKAAGDLVLDRVLGHSDPNRNLPSDFGTLLTGNNITAHLARSEAQLADWAAANAEFASQILAVARDPKAENRQADATCW